MKIAVFYYSQTGQASEVAKRLFATSTGNKDAEIVYKQITTDLQYKFPWDKFDFFDVFPETRLGIVLSSVKEIDFSDIADADLVVVVGQSWYLSPSQPIQAFFTDQSVCQYLQGRNVLFVNVCRNMWLKTYQKVRSYIQQAEALMVGHIVLQDRHSNLLSVLTIIRWLMFGRKEPSKMLPEAGVSEKDIASAARFGEIIVDGLNAHQTASLQDRLYETGAIDYKPSILFLEQAGHRIFGFWAKFIRLKGNYGDVRRRTRLNMFFYYLLFVLFVLSPFAQLFFYLTYPFRGVKRKRWDICHLTD